MSPSVKKQKKVKNEFDLVVKKLAKRSMITDLEESTIRDLFDKSKLWEARISTTSKTMAKVALMVFLDLLGHKYVLDKICDVLGILVETVNNNKVKIHDIISKKAVTVEKKKKRGRGRPLGSGKKKKVKDTGKDKSKTINDKKEVKEIMTIKTIKASIDDKITGKETIKPLDDVITRKIQDITGVTASPVITTEDEGFLIDDPAFNAMIDAFRDDFDRRVDSLKQFYVEQVESRKKDLEKRATESDTSIGNTISSMAREIGDNMNIITKKFNDRIDESTRQLNDRLDDVTSKISAFGALETMPDSLLKQLALLDKHMKRLDTRMIDMSNKMELVASTPISLEEKEYHLVYVDLDNAFFTAKRYGYYFSISWLFNVIHDSINYVDKDYIDNMGRVVGRVFCSPTNYNQRKKLLTTSEKKLLENMELPEAFEWITVDEKKIKRKGETDENVDPYLIHDATVELVNRAGYVRSFHLVSGDGHMKAIAAHARKDNVYTSIISYRKAMSNMLSTYANKRFFLDVE
jgi:hypothetical protein